MKALVNKYKHLMLRDGLPPQLPPSRLEDHHIDLVSGAVPPSKFPYRLSKALEGELEAQLADLLRTGFIRPSSSPFAAPRPLRHEEGQVGTCLCVEYRAVNKLTIKNKFPMPRIEYILERLDGAKFFIKDRLKEWLSPSPDLRSRHLEDSFPRLSVVTLSLLLSHSDSQELLARSIDDASSVFPSHRQMCVHLSR